MGYPVVVVPFMKVDGMALFPFMLVRTAAMKNDAVLIRHEAIHLQQAAELLVLPFYIFYLINYVTGLFRYRNHHEAYMNIAFEREAYANEKNGLYLKQRKLWSWLHYL